MPKQVKKNQHAASNPDSIDSGRIAQRNRTRKAIVDATAQLMAAGGTPSIVDIAKAAQVSRRTIYMYFPTLEQLLIDATLGALTANTIDPVVTELKSNDAVARAEQLSRAMNHDAAETMHLGRTLIRLTVESPGSPGGTPRRGYRRVQWIERALEPAREKLSRKEFDRLVSALCLLIGWEPLIVLKDIRCLDEEETNNVLTFAVRAIVEAALAAACSHAGRRKAPIH